jgi:hypothetical protein
VADPCGFKGSGFVVGLGRVELPTYGLGNISSLSQLPHK